MHMRHALLAALRTILGAILYKRLLMILTTERGLGHPPFQEAGGAGFMTVSWGAAAGVR